MRNITILNPPRLVFGDGSFQTFTEDFLTISKRRLFIITIEQLVDPIREQTKRMQDAGIEVHLDLSIKKEPDFESFHSILNDARSFKADAIVGIGGGSVLDVAKLVAAFIDSKQAIHDAVGIGKLNPRTTYLACLPTTSGTGSEVSPNAILLDQDENLKKGIISPWLVPDAAYIDPKLTYNLPPMLTAGTGLDALSHCLEAYTNVYAHPVIDLYALEGIRRISNSLVRAIKNGSDAEARADLSLGSMFGGICLGPVNTAAVHALSYPLGGTFHIAHGLSNAILLPHVMEFNLVASPQRHADVALALGAKEGENHIETARNGVQKIVDLINQCDIPTSLSELKIPKSAFSDLATGALKVTRLLKNNVREVTYDDAVHIYENAY